MPARCDALAHQPKPKVRVKALEVRALAPGTLDALPAPMSSKPYCDELLTEPPPDFTQFLSARLKLAPPDALDVLGTFLVNFEPSASHPLLNGNDRRQSSH